MAAPYCTNSEPPEIRVKLESLHRQKEIIRDLTWRLEAAQVEHNRLETEINQHRTSIAPIQKCPEEVIIMVFEFFSENSPALATELLLVCKHWYEIAVNAPQLWTHIEIEAQKTWNQQKEARKNNMQIQTCLMRSARLPLHITINLEDMSSRTVPGPGFLAETTCSTPLCQMVANFIEIQDLDDKISSHIWNAYFSNCLLKSISFLLWDRGMYMKRWKTLSLSLPRSYEGIEDILALFSSPAPNLAKPFISGDLYGISRTFTNLPSLEELVIGGADISNLDFLELDFHSIKRLEIRAGLANQHRPTSLQLSRFTNLEHLTVHTSRHYLDVSMSTTSIHLPRLKSLTLPLYKLCSIGWRVPVLQKLTFRVDRLGEPLEGLPDVQALYVRWISRLRSYKPEDDAVVRRSLEDVVLKYRRMQTLTIPYFLQHIWDRFHDDLKEEERLGLPAIVLDHHSWVGRD